MKHTKYNDIFLNANEYLIENYGIELKSLSNENESPFRKQSAFYLKEFLRKENDKVKSLFEIVKHKIDKTERLLVYNKRANIHNFFKLEILDDIFEYDAKNMMVDAKNGELFTYPIVIDSRKLYSTLSRPKIAIYTRSRIKNNIYQNYIFLIDKNSGEVTPNLYILNINWFSKQNLKPTFAMYTNKSLMDANNIVFGANLYQVVKGQKQLTSFLSRTDLGSHGPAKLAHIHMADLETILVDNKFNNIFKNIKHCHANQIVSNKFNYYSLPLFVLIQFAIQKYNIKNLNIKTLQPIENFLQGSELLNDAISSPLYKDALHDYCLEPYTALNDSECFDNIVKNYLKSR